MDSSLATAYCTFCFDFSDRQLYTQKCPVKRTRLFLEYISRHYDRTNKQAEDRGYLCGGPITDCQYCGLSLDVNAT